MEAVRALAVASLPPQLHADVDIVLRCALAVQSARAELGESSATRAADLQGRASAALTSFELAASSLHSSVALNEVSPHQAVDLAVSLWSSRRSEVAALKEATEATTPEAALLAAVAADFSDALDALEKKLEGKPVPWQLRYAADSDFAAGGGAGGQMVSFSGGRLLNANGVSIFEDVCCSCGVSIQDGQLYGVGLPRFHCLDCTDVSLCTTCHTTLSAIVSALPPDVSTPVAAVHGHIGHCCVLETQQPVLARETIFAQPSLPTRIMKMFEVYAVRPCFQWIDGTHDTIHAHTYTAVRTGAVSVAAALQRLSVPSDQPFVCLCMCPGPMWYTIEVGILLAGRAAAGLHDGWSPPDIAMCISRANAAVLILDAAVLCKLFPCDGSPSFPTLSTILLAPPDTTGRHVAPVPTHDALLGCMARAKEQGITILPLDLQASIPVMDGLRVELEEKPAAPAVAVFSSGSTGRPKGVVRACPYVWSGPLCTCGFAQIFTQEAWRKDIDHTAGYLRPHSEVSLYVPAWGADKLTVWRGLFNGACISFIPSALDRVFPSLLAVAPTELLLVPTLCQALRSEYAAAAAGERARRFELGLSKEAVSAGALAAGCVHAYDACLGGRMRMIGVGGAAVSDDLHSFLTTALPCLVIIGYGTSESGGICDNGKVAPGVDVKLENLPDLGYSLLDKPFPRGEICVKSSLQVKPTDWIIEDGVDLTSRYLPDGYFRTGDVGEMLPNGRLRVIDRVSSVVKLANGQFFSPQKVEAALLAHVEGLQYCVVTPGSDGATIVAMCAVAPFVSPSRITVDRLVAACIEAGIPPQDIPTAVLAECGEEWNAGNGSLTPNLKVSRAGVIARHRSFLASPVVAASLPRPAPACGVEGQSSGISSPHDLAVAILTELLGAHARTVPNPALLSTPLAGLGVSSLTLTRLYGKLPRLLSSLLGSGAVGDLGETMPLPRMLLSSPVDIASAFWRSSTCPPVAPAPGVPSPPPLLSQSSSSSSSAAARIAPALLRSSSQRHALGPADATVTIPPPDTLAWVRAREGFAAGIAAKCAALQAALPESTNPHKPRCDVLLTGASGFFGRFLLAELLRCLPPEARVHCIVRGDSAQSVRARVLSALRDVLGSEDAALRAMAFPDGAPRILPIPGDTSLPTCGLSQHSVHEMLPTLVAIVHAAAAVKFYPFQDGVRVLEGANVDSCGHIAAFACSVRPPIPIHLVSTGSVSAVAGLNTDTPSLSAVNALSHLDAYAATKLMGEVVLRQVAAVVRGFSLYISRPGLLTPSTDPTSYGFRNSDDWLTRLVQSCVDLALFPAVGAMSPSPASQVLFRATDGEGSTRVVSRASSFAVQSIQCTGWSTPVAHSPVNLCAAVTVAAIQHQLSAPVEPPVIISPEDPSSTLTPASVLHHVFTSTGQSDACIVPPYAWAVALRATPSAPFHPLLALGVVTPATGALNLSGLSPSHAGSVQEPEWLTASRTCAPATSPPFALPRK